MKVDPFIAVSISSVAMCLVLLVAAILYYALKSRRSRETTVYLSGEPESTVSMITPSILALYWGFMKRFARALYKSLVEDVHTGSLHDWYRFISSWLGLLLVLSVLVYIAALLLG